MSLPAFRRLAVAAAVPALAVALAASTSSAATAKSAVYSGSAYGTTAKLGGIETARTALLNMCTTTTGFTDTNNLAGVNLGVVGSIGAATTKVRSLKSGSKQVSVTDTETLGTNLLAGLVQATAITTKAAASRTSSAKYAVSGSSTFVGLKVGGVDITATPAKNTVIELPGIARVTLNAQTPFNANSTQGITVEAIKVELTNPGPVIPEGRIVVSSALAAIKAPVTKRAFGRAYDVQADLNGVIKAGPIAPVDLPCGGTSSGLVSTNSTATLVLPAVATAGVTTNTAKSTDSSSKTVSTATATIAGLDLFAGAIQVDAITAQAVATRAGSKFTTSSTGTTIAGLRINGSPVTLATGENQTLNIAGLGTLTSRKVVKTSDSIQVYALSLQLSVARGSLDVGAVVNIAAANAGVAK